MSRIVKRLRQHEVAALAVEVGRKVVASTTDGEDPIRLCGVPRGGIPAAYAVAAAIWADGFPVEVVDDPALADAVIDDIIDSGATRDKWVKAWGKPFFALVSAEAAQGLWVVFPWEENLNASADDIPIRLLQFIGEKPDRGGLKETPARFLKAWKHWSSGYGVDPASVLKAFEDGAEGCDQWVVVRDIPVYSQCEHHLAPFFGVAHVGYIPSKNIVGLSKLSRLVDIFARRLQVQERLTNQVADELEKHLKPQAVAVVIECRHMCMESRGIQRSGATTITSALRGKARTEPDCRAEFMKLIERK